MDDLDLNGVGGGNMTVRFDALNDVPDDIHNFDVTTDTLQFSLTIFTGLSAPGTIAAGQFFSASDVDGTGDDGTENTRFLYNTTEGDLFYDADGSGAGAAVHIATMQTVPPLTENDIVMIA